jgi:hypothetical protein
MRSQPLRAVLWPAWLAWTAVTWAVYAHVPPCPDHATFDYIGWMALNGSALYVDVSEQNWPGAMWLHLVSTWLLGNHLWSFRVFDYAVMLLGCAAVFRLLRWGGRAPAAWLFVPLYQGMYVTADQWLAGQRDIVAAHMLLIGTVCLVQRIRGGALGWVVPYGLLVAFAALTRPTYLVFGVLVFGVDWALSRSHGRTRMGAFRDHAVAGGVVIAVLGVVAAVFASTGALTAWYEAAVLYNTQLYSGSATVAEVTAGILGMPRAGWHWYLGFGAAGAAMWWMRGERLIFGLLACLFSTALISYYVQLKGFGYHLGAWLPVLAALIAELLAWAVGVLRERRVTATAAAALVVVAVAVAGTASKLGGGRGLQLTYVLGLREHASMLHEASVGIYGLTAADAVGAAQFARDHATPEQTVLVWGRGAGINFLAERRMPVPFASVGTLEEVGPPFAKAEQWLTGFDEVLRDRPPHVVFVPAESAGDEYERWQRPDPPRAVVALRRALQDDYRHAARFGAFEAYTLARSDARR